MFFTQNPIGSSANEDLQDNAISFDYAMNSPAALWQDRFGKQHKTVQQALKDVGFKPAGFDFVSGGTLGIGDRDKCVFYPTDGYWYSWNGKLPYVIHANSSPTPGGRTGWGVIERSGLVISMEALRRSYAEIGYSLRPHPESFNAGGKITSVNDVLMDENNGRVYKGPIGVVPPGTKPETAGFIDISEVLLRNYNPPFSGSVVRSIHDKLADIKTVKDTGAVVDGETFDTSSVVIALSNNEGENIYVPEGNMLIGTGVDTNRLSGPGKIKCYQGAVHTTPPSLRKDFSSSFRPRQPFEDEFFEHLNVDNESQYYTSFSSAVMIGAVEVYASRVGHEHSSNFSKRSSVVIHIFDKTAPIAVIKKVLYTVQLGFDIRDVNISPYPSKPGMVIVSFAEVLATGGYQGRIIVYNIFSGVIESNRLMNGFETTDFKWGNVLITPTGYLLTCSYTIDGTGIKIWKSSTVFNTSGSLNLTLAKTFIDTVASEPTIGYWKNRLVLFYRRTSAASKLTWSYGLEGDGYWQPTVYPHGTSAHAPVMLAYSDSDVWTAFFSDGTDRTKLGSTSSNNLLNFKSQTPFYTTGKKTGGYPSVIDLGGSYALAFYSEHYDEPGELVRTRIDRIEVDKNSCDLGVCDREWETIIELPESMSGERTGLMIGTIFGSTNLLASNSRDYTIEFMVNRNTVVSGLTLLCNGTSTGTIELYDDDTIISTSGTVTLNGDNAAPYLFSFNPITLTAGKKYGAKLKGSGNIGLYDYRHNQRRRTVLRIGTVDITGLKNNAGVAISATSLVPIGLRIS